MCTKYAGLYMWIYTLNMCEKSSMAPSLLLWNLCLGVLVVTHIDIYEFLHVFHEDGVALR